MKLYIIYSNDLGKFVMTSEAGVSAIPGFDLMPKIKLTIDEGMPISSDFATSLISHLVNQVNAFYGTAAQTAIIEITIP